MQKDTALAPPAGDLPRAGPCWGLCAQGRVLQVWPCHLLPNTRVRLEDPGGPQHEGLRPFPGEAAQQLYSPCRAWSPERGEFFAKSRDSCDTEKGERHQALVKPSSAKRQEPPREPPESSRWAPELACAWLASTSSDLTSARAGPPWSGRAQCVPSVSLPACSAAPPGRILESTLSPSAPG